MELHIWHDADGNIKALGQPLPGSSWRVVPMDTPDLEATVVRDVPEEFLKSPHVAYRVDVNTKQLVRRDSAK